MTVACPACNSRYDSDGYARGQQLRCRCGKVFTYEPPAAVAGALACPHCGGMVGLGDAKCGYCSAELLLKSCPRCMNRVFAGYQHCPLCGTELSVAAAAAATDMPCPRCDEPLHARLVGDVVIDECAKCQGVFLDQLAVTRVIADRERARADALFGAVPRHEIHSVPRPGEKMYLKCPVCHTVMNRKQFAHGAGIIIDVCRPHGTFFDAGKLPATIDFVMQGGLEAAAKKDLARERERLGAEREHAFAMSHQAGSTPDYSSRLLAGEAVIDLLSLLFR